VEKEMYDKQKETSQKPAGGFLIAHFKRHVSENYVFRNIQ